MILIIDNYDSFVYNLAHYLQELGQQIIVRRNNAISFAEINLINPSHIILSPGPCTPDDAGICLDVVKQYHRTIPILGVCLGHQAIAQAFGAKIIKSGKPMHGKSSLIQHNQERIFNAIAKPLQVGRYHSLIIEEKSLPQALEIIARSDDNTIMAIAHQNYPTFGVQFHPESILTTHGHELLRNFITTAV